MGLSVNDKWADIRLSYPVQEGLESDETKRKYSGFGADAGVGIKIGKGSSVGFQLGGESSNSVLGPTYSIEPMFYVRLRAGVMNIENEILDIGLGYWKEYIDNGKYSFSGVQVRFSEGFLFGEEAKYSRFMLSAGFSVRLQTSDSGQIPDSVWNDIIECTGYLSLGIRLSGEKSQENTGQ